MFMEGHKNQPELSLRELFVFSDIKVTSHQKPKEAHVHAYQRP